MPKEEAIVIEVLPEGALVRVNKSSACCGCPSSKLCNMGGSGVREVIARNPIGAKEGQRVVIEIRKGLLLKASCIMYMLPVFGLLMGGLIGRWIVMILGINATQDTGAVIGGLTCMIIVFILIKKISSRSSYMKIYQPTIIKTSYDLSVTTKDENQS